MTHILMQKDHRKEVSLKFKIDAEDNDKKERFEGESTFQSCESSVYLIYERRKDTI